jgi:NAD(P)H-dependent FMN reductase
MIKLMIILGSTRQGRLGDKVASWVQEQAATLSDVEIDFVDLRDIKLPFFNEPIPSAGVTDGNYTNEVAREWGKRVASQDAFLIITPEYNHSFPAVLKNALDYLYHEWKNKPVGFIGYGVVGAARAIEHLRGVVAQLQMASVQEAVNILLYPSPFDEDGKMTNEHYNAKFVTVSQQLLSWAKALKEVRNQDK